MGNPVSQNSQLEHERLSRLKDSFGCGSMWVKGHAKVLCHTSFAVLAVSVDALMRLMLYQEPPQDRGQVAAQLEDPATYDLLAELCKWLI